jgi:hypothetical protein
LSSSLKFLSGGCSPTNFIGAHFSPSMVKFSSFLFTEIHFFATLFSIAMGSILVIKSSVLHKACQRCVPNVPITSFPFQQAPLPLTLRTTEAQPACSSCCGASVLATCVHFPCGSFYRTADLDPQSLVHTHSKDL